ncbi:MAG: c-type cytochrome [Mariprofundaceae bacterium]
MAGIEMIRLLWSVIIISLVAVVGDVHAETIYQWRDRSGQLQFTDSLAKVPPEYRKTSARDISALQSMAIGSAMENRVAKINGEALWQSKCIECHHIGFGKTKDGLGLSRTLINSTTKHPLTVDTLLPVLSSAASGGDYDMPRQDLNRDELRAIAKYLLSAVSKNIVR